MTIFLILYIAVDPVKLFSSRVISLYTVCQSCCRFSFATVKEICLSYFPRNVLFNFDSSNIKTPFQWFPSLINKNEIEMWIKNCELMRPLIFWSAVVGPKQECWCHGHLLGTWSKFFRWIMTKDSIKLLCRKLFFCRKNTVPIIRSFHLEKFIKNVK